MAKLIKVSKKRGQMLHSAFEGALTFVSEPKLVHSAFHYPRFGNFISLFNKI